MTPTSDDSADAIAAALARLRGRGPRRPGAPEAEFGVHGRPGPHHPHGEHGHRGGHGWDEHRAEFFERAGFPGGARPGADGFSPWAHGRFAGPARLRLLEALAAASTPLSVGEIAERIGVDQPRASRLVQQSVKLGLVRREADPDDARRTRVVLTDEGARLLRGFRGYRRAAVDEALAGFSDAERAELARLLTKLADAWPR
ncbi:MarR family winged helix-turn-helix transcriptional regulator [Microbacterium luticocti]|uniref:MarR family winged helix-turn-helix transcriptional regulator n=1 Tax=Microbacterium luticocti TaxID=451764 RepID=UPI0004229681|nr:MarR family transcriptional regulator [Microbacterium luticocti]